MGNRPDELRALLDSVAKQDGDPVEVVVVGNGSPVPDVPEGVRTVELPENLGIPGGRNVGIEAFGPGGRDVDVLLFLDDDGLLPEPRHRRAVPRGLRRRPEARHRQLPHRRPGDRASPSAATSPGCAPPTRCAPRGSPPSSAAPTPSAPRSSPRSAGCPDEFFYAHEETDLAWRALDAGWMIDYRSDMVLYHPTTAPSRHAVYHRMVARNRVWLARRNLPAPLVPVYLGVWLLLTLLRRPSRPALKAWFGGFREGWTHARADRAGR